VSTPNAKGASKLWHAARRGERDVVERSLAAGVDPNGAESPPNASTALMEAARRDDLEMCELLVSRGASLAAVDGIGRTAIHHAAHTGALRVLTWLLDRGADIELRDQPGQTPLVWAGRSGSVALVELLLDRGADPTAADRHGRTALEAFVVARRDDPRRAAILGRLSTSLSAKAVAAATDVALRLGDALAVEVLSTSGDASMLVTLGDAGVDAPAAVDALIAKGADPNGSNARGERPLTAAAARGKIGVLSRLLHAGAEPDARGVGGQTALHRAARGGHAPSVEALLAAGAGLETLDDEGLTPLLAALAGRQEVIAHRLLDAGANARAETTKAIVNLATNTILVALGDMDPWCFERALFRRIDATLVRRLLEGGAPLGPVRYGLTPLHVAAGNPCGQEAVTVLVAHGADPDGADDRGETPRAIAARSTEAGMRTVFGSAPTPRQAERARGSGPSS